jgi:hypothetical protein
MFTLLRRLFWLAVLSGAGYAVYTTWQRKNEPTPDGPRAWPPLDDVSPASPAAAPVASSAPVPPTDASTDPSPIGGHVPSDDGVPRRDAWTTAAPGEQRWVDPVDGHCPPGYPIKANANSGIFHVPGGRFYERTVPERCYATEDDAVADGYRRAKA